MSPIGGLGRLRFAASHSGADAPFPADSFPGVSGSGVGSAGIDSQVSPVSVRQVLLPLH